MLGAIIGDIAGSRFEGRRRNRKSVEFTFFHHRSCLTDDTVMTAAVAQAIVAAEGDYSKLGSLTVASLKLFGRKFPLAGYGHLFRNWLASDETAPYNSYGNGAAMRVSPCGLAADSLDEALELATLVTEVTHNHPEGLKGAQATAAAVYLAKTGLTLSEIRTYINEKYYKLDFTLEEIRPHYSFDSSCMGSVPQAIEAFLESSSYEDAIRKAVSIGGDSDTIAAITGGIAGAFWGVGADFKSQALRILPQEIKKAIKEFEERFPPLCCPGIIKALNRLDRDYLGLS
ncbi:MAG: ADP-ribosylglycohydrolase family protein [Deltaproteobacteria bacterium]|jgi:type I restriction enzyme M protein|nr:ADP-ribosylglycohydrolase family protein [Deltaproteobacteria bacterium]